MHILFTLASHNHVRPNVHGYVFQNHLTSSKIIKFYVFLRVKRLCKYVSVLQKSFLCQAMYIIKFLYIFHLFLRHFSYYCGVLLLAGKVYMSRLKVINAYVPFLHFKLIL